MNNMMFRIRQALVRFFAGRRGMDQFGMALYAGGLVLYIVSIILRWGFLNLLSTVLWFYGIFRMLSRNIMKRERENQWFLTWFTPLQIKAKQAYTRFKNRKIYKYFRCPKCRSWIKLPRNIGEKTVTCGKCGHSFKKKA